MGYVVFPQSDVVFLLQKKIKFLGGTQSIALSMDNVTALQILGLEQPFTETLFKRRFTELSILYHPDKCGFDAGSEMYKAATAHYQRMLAARDFVIEDYGHDDEDDEDDASSPSP